MTYAAYTDWKSEKEIAAFDRLLDEQTAPEASHGTKELFSILGPPPRPPREGGS